MFQVYIGYMKVASIFYYFLEDWEYLFQVLDK